MIFTNITKYDRSIIYLSHIIVTQLYNLIEYCRIFLKDLVITLVNIKELNEVLSIKYIFQTIVCIYL